MPKSLNVRLQTRGDNRKGRPLQPETTLVMSANSVWNIDHFRAGLIRGLAANGARTIVVAPGASGSDRIDIAIERSGVNPLRDAALVMAYRRILSRIRPAAYLSFTIKPNIYGAMAARLAGVPAIPNVSGLGTAFLGGSGFARFVSWLYRLAFRRCPTVFFQNRDDRDMFVARSIVTLDQARLVPGSGIDLGHFVPAMGDDPATPTFLFIGRLLGDKGVHEYAEAARLVGRQLPGARCQLLGPIDGENRTAITRAELDRWIASGLVEYLGEAEDVRPYIAAATAVVLPSYREGLPRSLLEGAAMARPLVASDVPGCRDLVREGVNGTLCEPRNAASLAEAMLRLAELPSARRAQLGKASRTMVEERYSERFVIDAYLDALRALPGFKAG